MSETSSKVPAETSGKKKVVVMHARGGVAVKSAVRAGAKSSLDASSKDSAK